MIRRVITAFLNTHFGWLVDFVNAYFGFIVHQPAQSFETYASAHQAAPGITAWVAGLATFLVFAGGGVAFFYFLIEILTGTTRKLPLIPDINVPKFDRIVYSLGLYLLTVGYYVLTRGTAPELTRAENVITNFALVLDMYLNGGSQVGLEAFSYGVFANPEISFTLQVLILTIVSTGVFRYYVGMSELRTFVGLSGVAMVSWMVAELLGIQIFPIEARWAFTIQLLFTFGMVTVTAAFIYITGWRLVKFFNGPDRRDRYVPPYPERDEYLGAGAVFLIILGVFPSHFNAFLTFLSLTVLYIGGLSRIREVLSEPECEAHPQKSCELEVPE